MEAIQTGDIWREDARNHVEHLLAQYQAVRLIAPCLCRRCSRAPSSEQIAELWSAVAILKAHGLSPSWATATTSGQTDLQLFFLGELLNAIPDAGQESR